MWHRALGLLILAAGGLLAAVTQASGKFPSVSMLVISAALVATGLGMILVPDRALRPAGPARPASRRDELLASLAVADQGTDVSPEGEGLQQVFAVARGDDGRLEAVDRTEVDAYFECLLVRWRGPLALAKSEPGGEGTAVFADGLGGADTELRGDILQAERYLGGLLFREPFAGQAYADLIADLDALLRRLGDSRWGGFPASPESTT